MMGMGGGQDFVELSTPHGNVWIDRAKVQSVGYSHEVYDKPGVIIRWVSLQNSAYDVLDTLENMTKVFGRAWVHQQAGERVG